MEEIGLAALAPLIGVGRASHLVGLVQQGHVTIGVVAHEGPPHAVVGAIQRQAAVFAAGHIRSFAKDHTRNAWVGISHASSVRQQTVRIQ